MTRRNFIKKFGAILLVAIKEFYYPSRLLAEPLFPEVNETLFPYQDPEAFDNPDYLDDFPYDDYPVVMENPDTSEFQWNALHDEYRLHIDDSFRYGRSMSDEIGLDPWTHPESDLVRLGK